jgi:aspartate aminotransferase-like enzyme/GNAT superfamily N-acetyltransferase
MEGGGGLTYRIATREEEFEAIHRLNHRTFTGEIPQHPADPSGRLVDRFHGENTYAVALEGERLVGMVAGRSRRPFSLDEKLPDLDAHLPRGHRPVEIRLLAVEPGRRGGVVFSRLVGLIAERFRNEGCDLAVISGTLRQERLYRHMGFEPFGPVVGSGEALFRPMFLTLEKFIERSRAATPPREGGPPEPAVFLPGPVRSLPGVRRAMGARPISHRSEAFAADLRAVKRLLRAMTGAEGAEVLVGSGTLANDAVGGRLALLDAPGIVLSNGEFGQRLEDHASRWGLKFETIRAPWGEPFDPRDLAARVAAVPGARWLWAVHGETSTGVLNDLGMLRAVAAERDLALCIDAISTVGTMPVDLRGVRFATCTSGKGLGSYPGLCMVLRNGEAPRPAPGRLPRYLDLGAWEEAEGVPFTASSNLLGALLAALGRPDWADRYARIAAASARLRAGLRAEGLKVVAADACASPAVTTVALPQGTHGPAVLETLLGEGLVLHGRSGYLARRGWVQVCLMGEWDDGELDRVPGRLAAATR